MRCRKAFNFIQTVMAVTLTAPQDRNEFEINSGWCPVNLEIDSEAERGQTHDISPGNLRLRLSEAWKRWTLRLNLSLGSDQGE